MDCIKRFDIVRSRAGHDSGKLFLVLDFDSGHALIADGKTRKLERPKRKSLKHLELLPESIHPKTVSIGSSTISNREIYRLLAACRRNARQIRVGGN